MATPKPKHPRPADEKDPPYDDPMGQQSNTDKKKGKDEPD